MWDVETVSETERPLGNRVRPLHTTDKETEIQEMEGFMPGHRQGKFYPRIFWIQILTSLYWIVLDACACTPAWYVSLRLVFINSSPHSKY